MAEFSTIAIVGHAWPHVLMRSPSECFCVPVAVPRLLSVGGVTEARFTACQAALRTPGVNAKGKLADGIRQQPVAAPCTPKETVVTAPDWVA